MSQLNLNSLLAIDALTCAAMGGLLMAVAGPVGALTDLPAPFLFWAGALLLPIAAFMAVNARSRPVAPAAVWFIVLGNIGWVIASLALPALGLIQPNLLGWTFLIAQAAVVAVLTRLEAQAMRDQMVAA